MKMKFKEQIAKELKLLRQSRDLTQTQLSKLSGVDTSTIVRYEKNNVTMQIDTIIKLIAPYNISVENFFKQIVAKTQEKALIQELEEG